MAALCAQCGRAYPTGERGGHCTVCHESFSGDTLFDWHIIMTDPRGCKTPEDMRAAGFIQRATGYWGWNKVYDPAVHRASS